MQLLTQISFMSPKEESDDHYDDDVDDDYNDYEKEQQYDNEQESDDYIVDVIPNKIMSGIAQEPDMIKIHQQQIEECKQNEAKTLWICNINDIDSFTKTLKIAEAYCYSRYIPVSISQYQRRCKFLISQNEYNTDSYGNDERIYIPKSKIKYNLELLQYTTIEFIVFGGHFIHVGDYVDVKGIIIYTKQQNIKHLQFRLFSASHPSINITVKIHEQNKESIAILHKYSKDHSIIFVQIRGIVSNSSKPAVTLCSLKYLPNYSMQKLKQNNNHIENEIILINATSQHCKPEWIDLCYEQKLQHIIQCEDNLKHWLALLD